jgi:hypothetical protein
MAQENADNAEWRLSDFLDALGAEVDRAQDTLSLKSHARGMTVAVQGLALDLAVHVRVDGKGQVYFRSAQPGEAAATVLKVDLREAFQSQLEEVRRPLDDADLGLLLTTLSGITAAEVERLHALSTFTVEDLRRLCRAPALLSEVSRKTGIAETRLRDWLELPFLLRVEPPAGSPGQTAVLAGGHLGRQDGDDAVFFQGAEARVLGWEDARITVEIPAGAVPGPVYARIDEARSNALLWSREVPVVDPPPDEPEEPEEPPAGGLAVTRLIPDRARSGILVTVTIEGRGFQPGVTISFGRGITAVMDRVSSGHLAANLTIPPRIKGSRALTVTNPDGTSVSLPNAFRVLGPGEE